MKMNPTQLNGYNPLDPVQKRNENPQLETEQNGNFDKHPVEEEDLRIISNQNISAQNSEVLSGTEQAILHGLFGSEKPRELSFYGQSEIGHIHRGKLVDISG